MNVTNVANEMSVVSEVNMSEIALKLAEQLSLREGLVQNKVNMSGMRLRSNRMKRMN